MFYVKKAVLNIKRWAWDIGNPHTATENEKIRKQLLSLGKEDSHFSLKNVENVSPSFSYVHVFHKQRYSSS